MITFFFHSRMNLNLIASAAPIELKKSYAKIMSILDIECSESDSLDFEDWVESVIPLVEVYKLDSPSIFVSGNLNGSLFGKYLSKSTSLPVDIVLLGLYHDFNYIAENFPIFKESKLIFPKDSNSIDYEGLVYFNLSTFHRYANRSIYGPVSTFDTEGQHYSLDSLSQLNKNPIISEYSEETVIISKEEAEYTSSQKHSQNYISLGNLCHKNYISLGNLCHKNYISLGNLCHKNYLEQVLSDLSCKQTETSKTYFIKTIKKKWALPITIDKKSTPADIFNKLLVIFEYQWSEQLRHSHNSILLQDFADIQYEYRFIIINGKLVCGSGCIEEFTPLNNISGKFDSQIVKYRNLHKKEGSPLSSVLEINSNLVALFTEFANTIVSEFNEEDSSFFNYTLDIAMINGSPGIVEINPYQNVGFYALDYSYILDSFKS